MQTIHPVDLGVIGYQECYSLQCRLVALRAAGEIEDTLLLLEHPPVITIGTAGGRDSMLVSPEALEKAGVEVIETNRGGNITYHGPGQLVGYPIIDLHSYDKDVHRILRNLEQTIIDSLVDFGISGEALPELTGVWVGGDKICSIGLAVRKWVTYHGFSLNVEPDFSHWSMIHPCGLTGRRVTSIEKLIGRNPGMAAVKDSVAEKLAKVLDTTIEPMGKDDLLTLVEKADNR